MKPALRRIGVSALTRDFSLAMSSDAVDGYFTGSNRSRASSSAPYHLGSAAVSSVAEVCYPFCRKHGRNRAVKRREFITLLGGAVPGKNVHIGFP